MPKGLIAEEGSNLHELNWFIVIKNWKKYFQETNAQCSKVFCIYIGEFSFLCLFQGNSKYEKKIFKTMIFLLKSSSLDAQITAAQILQHMQVNTN